MGNTVLIVLLSCLAVVLATREDTSACRDVTRQTCQGFQQCCARRCGGPHQTSCSESGGRISQASCECEGRGTHGSGSFGLGTGGQNVDHSALCRLVAEGSCNSFRTCCENKCVRPSRMTCQSRNSQLTDYTCQCPPGSPPSSPTGSTGSHSSHGGSQFQYTTPRSPSHGGGLRENAGEEDFTHTCSRNYRDCTAFRSCCQNRCTGRTIQSQCQESGGHLKNTICKCGRPF